MYVQQQIGQSNYDLCLQAYCTQDLLVKFCADNGIEDINQVKTQTSYYFDETLVADQTITGYVYTTDVEGVGRIFSSEFSMEFS